MNSVIARIVFAPKSLCSEITVTFKLLFRDDNLVRSSISQPKIFEHMITIFGQMGIQLGVIPWLVSNLGNLLTILGAVHK